MLINKKNLIILRIQQIYYQKSYNLYEEFIQQPQFIYCIFNFNIFHFYLTFLINNKFFIFKIILIF